MSYRRYEYGITTYMYNRRSVVDWLIRVMYRYPPTKFFQIKICVGGVQLYIKKLFIYPFYYPSYLYTCTTRTPVQQYRYTWHVPGTVPSFYRTCTRVLCSTSESLVLLSRKYIQALYSSFFPSPPYLTTLSFHTNFSDQRNLIAVVILYFLFQLHSCLLLFS